MSNNIGNFASQVASGIKNLITNPHVAIANNVADISKGIANQASGIGKDGIDHFVSGANNAIKEFQDPILRSAKQQAQQFGKSLGLGALN